MAGITLDTVLSLIAAATGLYVARATWLASRRPTPVIERRLEPVAGRDGWQKVWIIVRNPDRAALRITTLSVRPLWHGRLLPQNLSHADDGFSSEGMAAAFHRADTARTIDLGLSVGPGGQEAGYGMAGSTVSFWAVGQNLSSSSALRVHWQRSDR